MRSHLKVYFDFEVKAKEYDDAEKGRLLLAMLRYAKDGTEGNLTGNERFVFPVFKAQIDEDIRVYETKVSNGSNGGRPPVNNRKPKEAENNRTEPEETETAKKEERRKKKEDKRDSIGRFTPPDLSEVRSYCIERNNNVDPEAFVDFYQSKGWMVGKNKMKDWKAAVRSWEKKHPKEEKKTDSLLDDIEQLALRRQ
jgi:hypothetical protein